MKKILVVIDVQKDFYHPDGALYVKGGEELPQKIAGILSKFDGVIFTMDWHPKNHCSFIDNGGIWEKHCVAYTEGSSLPNEFIPYISEYFHDNRIYNIILKGSDYEKEEYGCNPNYIMGSHDEECNDVEFVFCGIHALYCVKETIIKFKQKFPDVPISILKECIVPYNNEEFNEFCKLNNINEYKIWE